MTTFGWQWTDMEGNEGTAPVATPATPLLVVFQRPGAAPTISHTEPVPAVTDVATTTPVREFEPGSFPLAWDRDRLVLTTPAAIAKINRARLSPSSMIALQGCPARWVADRLLPEEPDPFGAAEKGTSAHKLMEELFGLPGRQRTPEMADLLLSTLAQRHGETGSKEIVAPDIDDAEAMTKWRTEVGKAMHGLWEIEDPTKVQVAATEMSMNTVDVGGVPFVGFIDRSDFETLDGRSGRRIVDFKTGKVPNTHFNDHQGDQLRLYTLAATAMDGVKPTSAHLYYTKFGKSKVVNISAGALSKTERDFQNAWTQLQSHVRDESVPAKSSALCGWCPLATVCPVAARDGKGEARIPSAHIGESLGIPTIRPLEISVSSDFDDFSASAADFDEPITDPAARLDYESLLDEPIADPADAPELEPAADPAAHLDYSGFDDESSLAPTPATAPTEVDPSESAPTSSPDSTSAHTSSDELAGSAPDDDFAEAVDSVTAAANESTDDPVTDPDDGSSYGVEDDSVHSTTTDNTEGAPEMARWLEDKRWEEVNADGKLNPDSFAASAVFGLTTLAVEQLHFADQKITGTSVKALANTLGLVVRNAQDDLAGNSSFHTALNTRLRGALYTTIKTLPLPFGKPAEEWEAWVEKATKRLEAITKVALGLWTDGASQDAPWVSLAG